MSLDESYGAMQQGLKNASPDASGAVTSTLNSIVPMLDQLDDKMLDALLQVVQYLKDHEQEYSQLVAQIEQEGGGLAGIFPPEYDPEFLGTLAAILMHAKQSRSQGQEAAPELAPPPGMARGGIAEAARAVAREGRGNDSMIAHITPREANLLRAHGGMGTINPSTGVLEFDFWDELTKPFKAVGDVIGDVIKPVVNVVKEVVSSPVGKIIATVGLGMLLGPAGMGIASSMMAPALASAGVTLLSGGSLTDALIGGATAYFGAPGGIVSEFVGSIGGGIVGSAMNAAISSGLTGVAGGLLRGKSFEESVKNGLISGAIGGGMAALAPLPNAENLPDISGKGPALTENTGAGTEADASKLATTGNLATDTQAPTDVNSLVVKPGEEVKALGPGNSQVAAAQGPTDTAQTGIMSKAKGMYDEYVKPWTPSGIKEAGVADAEAAGKAALDRLPANATDSLKTAAYQKAYDAAMPGMIAQYGPMAAAGLAGLALTGGFSPKSAPATPEAQAALSQAEKERADLAANPSKWTPQNLPGVTYDSQGRITGGGNSWNPMPAPGTTEVAATNYVDPYKAPATPTYTPPPNAIGGGKTISQPYNTASMYTNLIPAPMQLPTYTPAQMQLPMPMRKPVRYAAMGGGIGSLGTGGYPRKTGAIAGPGTETSDSIPAMLSDGEFVMTAKAVRGAGKGSKLAGAKKMYALMHQLERNAARS
jgi:hypothetical protein